MRTRTLLRTRSRRIKQIEESVARYLLELDRADREPALVSEARVQNLEKKLEAAKAHIERLRDIQAQLSDDLDGPYCTKMRSMDFTRPRDGSN